jgi:hypothetical protein
MRRWLEVKSERELVLERALRELHTTIVGILENELSLEVATGGSVDAVRESMEILRELNIQDKFDEEEELLLKADEWM